jgi:hypothetical protein
MADRVLSSKYQALVCVSGLSPSGRFPRAELTSMRAGWRLCMSDFCGSVPAPLL